MNDRIGSVNRTTGETSVKVSLNLDGKGEFQGGTGIGFLDHMLHLWTRHGLFDLALEATGDLQVDAHHTVEDVGICLGQAFNTALGEKKGHQPVWLGPPAHGRGPGAGGGGHQRQAFFGV